jgi:Trypsin-like peptidase domain
VRPPIPSLALALAIGLSDSPAQENQPSNFSSYSKYLLLVEGDRGRGSASIIEFRGNPLIVTNAHVLSGNNRVDFRTLNNRVLTAGTFGVARDVDIAVFTQDEMEGGLKILEDADQNAAVGDEILVLGNSLGKAVATELRGKIVGIGPELIEVDAKFVSGNSGSPIIHVKSGKVIALATFATWQEPDPLVEDSPFKEVRRFGVRIDTISTWEYPTWEKFAGEAQQLASSIRAFNSLITLANDIGDDGYLDALLYTEAEVRFQRRVRNYIEDIKRPRMASSYYLNTKAEFLRWIETQAAEPPANLRPQTFTRYHGHSLERMLLIRRKMREFFGLVRVAQGGGDRIEVVQRELRDRWAR